MGRPGSSLFFALLGPGIGDALWYTAAFPALQRQGFERIDVCTWENARPVLLNNPHIRRLMFWEREYDGEGAFVKRIERFVSVFAYPVSLAAHGKRLVEWFKDRAREYDVAVLTGFDPLAAPGTVDASVGHVMGSPVAIRSVRDSAGAGAMSWIRTAPPSDPTTTNYGDYAVQCFGITERRLLPHLYPTFQESLWLSRLQRPKRGPLLLWHVGGSVIHKQIPQAACYVAALLARFPGLHVELLGAPTQIDPLTPVLDRLLTDEQRSRCPTCGPGWSLRQQLLATSIADVVVGPESAILNAAAAFDTPKVLFLSHSAHVNLSLWWWNVYPIAPDARCPCSPCYHSARRDCLVYADEVGTVERPARDEDRAPVGVKCCLFLNDCEVLETIGSILNGRRDRTCPACGAQRNRLTDGRLVCECGTVFPLQRPLVA